MSRKQEKWMEYAVVISEALSEVVKKYDEDLEDEENLTHFVHAMANVAPATIFSALTGGDHGYVDFNHIANKLCFQFGRLVDAEKEA